MINVRYPLRFIKIKYHSQNEAFYRMRFQCLREAELQRYNHYYAGGFNARNNCNVLSQFAMQENNIRAPDPDNPLGSVFI